MTSRTIADLSIGACAVALRHFVAKLEAKASDALIPLRTRKVTLEEVEVCRKLIREKLNSVILKSSSFRYVSYGDVVLARDVSEITDFIVDAFCLALGIIKLYMEKRVTIPKEACDLVKEITEILLS
ncbi:MAG: hypothetical protein QW407_05455 [Thermofilaceae archaeon]